MRVLFISHSSVTAYHQQKLEELAKNHGIEVHLATPPSWPEGGAVVRASTQSSLIKYHIGSTVNVRGMQHFYADAGAIITGSKPDIIHIEEEPFTLACAQFVSHAKKRDIPSIFFTWENIARSYNPVYSFLNRYSIGSCAAAVAGNEEAAGIIKRQRPGLDVRVIPQYGINASDFTPKKGVNTKGTLKVAYAGRLTPEKGIETLIDAVAACGNMILTVAGTGDPRYAAALKERANFENEQGRVNFPGLLDREELGDLYEDHDVLVLPSLTTPKWKEQFGRVLVEAMASGTVVVGSDSGEIKNVIGGAGLVFKENDAGDLAEKLRLLDRDRGLLASLSAAGISRSDGFTNTKIAASLAALFEAVLKKGG